MEQMENLRILIIEDNEDDATLLSLLLGKLTFYNLNIKWANTSEDGIVNAVQWNPQIVFVDYRLDTLNGLEVIRKIQQHNPEPDLILVTDYATESILAETIQYGIDDFVVKNKLSINLLDEVVKRSLLRTKKRIKQLNVLLVDDNLDDLELMSTLFQRLKSWNFNIEVAQSGQESLQKVEKSQPDIVFIDYQLDGYIRTDLIKSMNKIAHSASYVLISNHDSLDMLLDALKSGATDFVPKEKLSMESLENTLKLLINKKMNFINEEIKKEKRTA
ncbi:MAG: response regulator [Calditrichae bacterium]|nr:response regulator [Calditrichia bacterium]